MEVITHTHTHTDLLQKTLCMFCLIRFARQTHINFSKKIKKKKNTESLPGWMDVSCITVLPDHLKAYGSLLPTAVGWIPFLSLLNTSSYHTAAGSTWATAKSESCCVDVHMWHSGNNFDCLFRSIKLRRDWSGSNSRGASVLFNTSHTWTCAFYRVIQHVEYVWDWVFHHL